MEIKRDIYLNRLIERMHNGFVKVITGIRRCGKSYLLFNLFKRHLLSLGVKASQIVEIALDDKKFEALRDPLKLSEYLQSALKPGFPSTHNEECHWGGMTSNAA